jgi:membrane protein implicated in regulation of membrane protease activity
MRDVVWLIVFVSCLCAFLANIDWEWRILIVLTAILAMLAYIAAVLEEMLKKSSSKRGDEK